MSDRSGNVDEAKDDGLADLYRRHSAWLTGRLRRRFGDETDDLVQEAWVRAAPYSRSGSVRHPRALLMRIVDNLVTDRSRRRQPQPLSGIDHPVAETASEPGCQTEAVLLKQILRDMPPALREVFVLSRFAHLEYQDIGARLGIPVTTVQWRMRQALEYCAVRLRL